MVLLPFLSNYQHFSRRGAGSTSPSRGYSKQTVPEGCLPPAGWRGGGLDVRNHPLQMRSLNCVPEDRS